MIAPAVVEEIRSLLTKGKLSQRAIARVTQVSRGTVGAIATGRRPDYETLRRSRRDDTAPLPLGPRRRCPGCGGMVYMPCHACRIRDTAARRPWQFDLRWLALLDEPLGLDLRDEERARYEEVRAQRAAAAQSSPDTAGLSDALDFDDEDIPLDPTDVLDAFDPKDQVSADDELDVPEYEELLMAESTGEGPA